MSYLIFAVIILSIMHFVIDGIVVPSIRQVFHNKLCHQRDRLRSAQIEGVTDEQKVHLENIHGSINVFLVRLPTFSFWELSQRVAVLRRDKPRLEASRERVRRIQECGNPTIVDVFDNTRRLVREAHIINSSGWFLYVIPFAPLVVLWDNLRQATAILVAQPAPPRPANFSYATTS